MSGYEFTNVSYEDVGNYTCEVNGPQNTLLGSVTYTIFVKAPLELLVINSVDDLDSLFEEEIREGFSNEVPKLPKSTQRRFNFTLSNYPDTHHPSGPSLYQHEESIQRKTTHFGNSDNTNKISPPTKSQLIFGNDIPKFDLNAEEIMTLDTGHAERNAVPLTSAEGNLKHSVYKSAFPNSRPEFKGPTVSHVSNYKLPSSSSREVNYTENKPGKLSCIAVGLYPPTSLTLLIGSKNITNSLKYCLRAYPGKGIKGLRLIHFEVARWTENLLAMPEDNGQYLQCNAAFTGIPLVSNFSCVRMVVNYAPKVTCPSVSTLMNQLEAKLSCRISSQPGIVSINWLSPRSGSSVNSSTIQQTMESSEYTLQNRIVDGVIETSLIIRRVQEKHFGVYNVTAENGLEVGWGTADLRKRETHLSPKSWAFVEHNSNQALKRGVVSHYYQKSSLSEGTHSMLTTSTFGCLTIIIRVLLPVIF